MGNYLKQPKNGKTALIDSLRREISMAVPSWGCFHVVIERVDSCGCSCELRVELIIYCKPGG